MNVTLSYGADRAEVAVVRVLDLDRRRLHLAIPWDQEPVETMARVRGRLSPEEETAVRVALGLDGGDDAA